MTYAPRFTTPLVFQDNGGFPFILLQPLTYVTDVNHRGTFSVPAGFPTDLASTPKLLWWLFPPMGRYDKAAVVHDFLYHYNGVTRQAADATLLEAMQVCGVARWVCWTFYFAVRSWGWLPWRRYRLSEA